MGVSARRLATKTVRVQSWKETLIVLIEHWPGRLRVRRVGLLFLKRILGIYGIWWMGVAAPRLATQTGRIQSLEKTLIVLIEH